MNRSIRGFAGKAALSGLLFVSATIASAALILAGPSGAAATQLAGSANQPMCVSLLSTSAIGSVFHVSHLSGPSWHLYGAPETTCSYGAYPNQLITGVYGSSTSSQFTELVKTWPGGPGTKAYPAPSLGSHADAIKVCEIGCTPTLIVLTKGYLIELSDGLPNANWQNLPAVETLARKYCGVLHVPA